MGKLYNVVAKDVEIALRSGLESTSVSRPADVTWVSVISFLAGISRSHCLRN